MSKVDSRADAEALQQALADQEVRVALVAQDWLRLPAPMPCRRLDVTRAGLVTWHAAQGEASTVPWRRVLLLAAGCCEALRREPAARQPDPVLAPAGRSMALRISGALASPASSSHESRERSQVMLDVITDEPGRYRVLLDQFDYGYLGSRRGHSAWQNFPLLARDLLVHAPDAVRTPGMAHMAGGAARPLRYPSVAQIDRESAWALWRYCGPGAALDGDAPYRSQGHTRPRLSRPLGPGV
jgi:hypothetical protein